MPSFSLFATHPTGEHTEHLLGEEARVGRSPDCEVCVSSALLSQVHFVLRREGDSYTVVSQHPAQAATSHERRPGIYVNEERVEGSRSLAIGDTISPMAVPGPTDPRFVLGKTKSPTPADQLPQPPKGFSGAGCAAVIVLGVIAIGALVFFLTR